MTDDAPFLRDILENPDDDAPRLIYADWLDEHGGCDRAEFIRVQIELARMAAPWCKAESRENNCEELGINLCDWCAPRRRERELLYGNVPGKGLLTNEFEWLTPVLLEIQQHGAGPGELGGLRESKFHRGFLEEFKCTTDFWLKHCKFLFGHYPVRLVTLTDRPEGWRLRIKAEKLEGMAESVCWSLRVRYDPLPSLTAGQFVGVGRDRFANFLEYHSAELLGRVTRAIIAADPALGPFR
jgi:uncharacterized protein (TIGR02996 family)